MVSIKTERVREHRKRRESSGFKRWEIYLDVQNFETEKAAVIALLAALRGTK